jgi:simple sugar transport system permease protein
VCFAVGDIVLRELARSARAPLLTLIAATGLSAIVLLALLAAGHFDTAAALQALWRGSIGSPYAVFSATLVRATPLILAGLAVSLAFRAGVLNIGAEGQLLAGAAAAAAVGVLGSPILGGAILPLELAAGAGAGALWAAPAALLRRRFGALEVMSTLMLNFVALNVVSYLVRGPLQEPTHIYPQTIALPEAARLPALAPGMRLHAGFLLALVAAASMWWTLRFTAAGFRVRAAGANPSAAAIAGGIDVPRTTTAAFLMSGGLAGLAGAVEVAGVTFALYENLSPGYGYTAIAVALLARLNPLVVVMTGVLFGALEAGAAAMQRDASVPSEVVAVVEALVILVVLAADRMRDGRSRIAMWMRGGTPGVAVAAAP